MPAFEPVEQRFYKFISPEPNTGCWLWTGTRVDGYGVIATAKRKSVKAHRLSFEMLKGPLLDGLLIDHMCRNRACVNPEHLRQVDRRTNNLENSMGQSAINAQKIMCNHGHTYTEENTKIYLKEDGSIKKRECIACAKRRNMARYKAKHE